MWEWAAAAGYVAPLFFPAPSLTFTRLANGLADGSLLEHLGATVLRVIVGFVVGTLPAVSLGLIMSRSRRVNVILDPLFGAIHPLPKISLLPLIILLVGVNENSRLIVIALSVFFPLLINTLAGIRQIDPALYDIARTYHAGRVDVVRYLLLPASLPFVLAGARLGLNTALTMAVAVELVFASSGLGTVVLSAWRTMRTENLYAALLLIALLGVGINGLMNLLARWLIPWHHEREREKLPI